MRKRAVIHLPWRRQHEKRREASFVDRLSRDALRGPPFLYAQQTGASITGHVTDPSGAAIAGAKIVITSTATGSVYSTESDDAGIYRIPFAAIGEYTLTAEKAGFKTYVQKGVTLIIDQKVTVDVKLELVP